MRNYIEKLFVGNVMSTDIMGSKDNLEHLRKFGQKTSIKGVPRAINAEYRILQVLWTLGVIILLTVCIQQVGSFPIYFCSATGQEIPKIHEINGTDCYSHCFPGLILP